MPEASAELRSLNLVVADVDASLAFYRRLGTAPAEEAEPGAVHVELPMPGGISLELDTAESARLWHAGWRADPASVSAVIGFALPSRQAVDDMYAELTASGHPGRQPPFDAFWGGRYAIVADPDGNDVGLMSPIDESLRRWPPEPSPDA